MISGEETREHAYLLFFSRQYSIALEDLFGYLLCVHSNLDPAPACNRYMQVVQVVQVVLLERHAGYTASIYLHGSFVQCLSCRWSMSRVTSWRISNPDKTLASPTGRLFAALLCACKAVAGTTRSILHISGVPECRDGDFGICYPNEPERKVGLQSGASAAYKEDSMF